MVNFCPQCGSKLQPDFKFCPSCGGRLPEDSSEPLQAIYSELHLNSVHQSESCSEGSVEDSALSRTPLRSTRRKTLGSPATPTEAVRCTDKKSQRKGKKSNQVNEQEETTQTSSVTLQTPDKSLNLSLKRKASHEVNEEKTLQTSVMSPSPSKCKHKKRVSTVIPVQVGTEVCDQSSKKWKLVELLWQTELDLTYAVCQVNQYSDSNECKYIMKLGAKDGHLFNEQNFHQRAAKTDAVEKWVKLHKMDFLGIPPCVGFGLHEAYRFLVFPSMGQTLQSILDERSGSLSEKAVLQVALQLLDSLEFIHEKEYTHADIHAGNIYIKTNGHTEVFLSGFGYAFRYCPGGNHVEYRPGSRRTAHQGNIHFISLDSHKGAGPSRRSDLQSLGYCMLSWMTGTLPWSHMTNTSSAIAAEKQKFISDIPGLVSCCYKKRDASSALMAYLSNVMNLQYPEKPDYSHLKAGLHESLQKMGGTLKGPLDLQIMSPGRDVHTQSSTSLEKYPGTKWSEGVHILEQERELMEALRRVQQEEGRSIQLQRELLQQFREMDAERRALQNQKCEKEQEHTRLRKEKEEIQKKKNELQKEKEQMQKEREEFQKEKEELEKQKQELDSWKNAPGQAQTSGFYNF